MNLIPWKRKSATTNGNGTLTSAQDFPVVLRRMRSELDELFSEFAKNRRAFDNGAEGDWKWGLEVADHEDQIAVRAEAPGFEPDDFDVRVTGDRLVIRATHNKESKKKDREVQEQREYFESFLLPQGVDPTKVDAKYKNGVLFVSIPKTKEGRGQRIAVKAD